MARTCKECGGSGNSYSSTDWRYDCPRCAGMGSLSDAGGRDCFPSFVNVRTPRGNIPISEVKVNDQVLSFDPYRGICTSRVSKKIKHSRHRYLEVQFEDKKKSLFVTARHPVMTKQGWKRVRDLNSDDILISLDSTGAFCKSKVSSVRWQEHLDDVYNLLVEDTFNYLSEGYLSHSFVQFPRLRLAIKRLKPFHRDFLEPATSKLWSAGI